MPWALDLALACLDRRTGQFIHLPRGGGYLDQDEYIMNAIKYAWRAWYVWSIDDADRNDSDIEFMDWVSNDDN